VQGSRPGPTGFLSAGIHGDEIHAITVLHRFLRGADFSQLKGRLLIVPIANVSGFHAGRRLAVQDDKDLNRCFPGNPKGTLSERIAYFIFTELVAVADWGVDLHDSGIGSVLLPHARVHDHEVLDLGAAFGTEIIMKTTLPPGYHGILSIEARKKYRRPFFHVEIGGGAILWEEYVRQGITGLRNLLVYNRMLPGKVVLPQQQFFLPGRDDLAMPAPIEGLLTQHVAPGQVVAPGQALATIRNPLNEEQAVIRARITGLVLDLNVRAKVNAGEDVVGVIGFGMFNGSKSTPWRNSMEKKINQPGKTVGIRNSSIFKQRAICWQPNRLPTPAVALPGLVGSFERSRRSHAERVGGYALHQHYSAVRLPEIEAVGRVNGRRHGTSSFHRATRHSAQKGVNRAGFLGNREGSRRTRIT
jgi:hypothetical protein